MGTILKAKSSRLHLPGGMRIRILLTYIALIAVVLVLLNTYPITVSRDLIFASKNTTLLNQASLIGVSVEAVDDLAAESISQVMALLDTSDLDGVVITDADALLLYDSRAGAALSDSELFTRATTEAFSGNDWFCSTFSSGVFTSAASAPIMRGSSVAGSVVIYQYDKEQGAIIRDLQITIIQISLAIFGTSVILSVFLSRTLANRITRVLKAIKSVREGEYSYRIEVTGHDELSELASEFNSLTNRLQKTEEVRRRFVSDASHELKTPLASIRLLADSIVQNSEMDAAMVREFVGDIGNEAERLARTTEKLLSLTRMDNSIIAARECVDLKKTAGRVVNLLQPLADASNITLSWTADGDCRILAASDDIFQIMLNLVENAIKYNIYGGSVELDVRSSGGDVFITVDDTGIGIPEADLPHIFDRFYRVDKARSREAGGSGLGLSIVQSAVKEHGGKIFAERRDSGGMRFTVRFPLYQQPDAFN